MRGFWAAAVAVVAVVAGASAAVGVAPASAGSSAYADLPSQAPAVLEPTPVEGSTAPAPSPDGVAAAVADIITSPRLGDATSAVVLDPATGTVLLDYNGSTPRTPASTLKVLSALAAVQALGPQTRLATRVAQASDGSIVLIGGGDSTLALIDRGAPDNSGPDFQLERATLADLADRTAAKLTSTSVALTYDASLFGAPYVSPDWSPLDVAAGAVGPVTALMVDGGRVSMESDAREEDPAAAAAAAFAALLADRGITVTSIAPGTSPAGAQEIARVESAPIVDMVTLDLTNSDNDVTEALAHLAGAKASGTGTFASGAAATISTLSAMGIDTTGVVLVDGSGLAATNAVPAMVLAEVMAAIASPGERAGTMWPLASSLAVAGLTGTLNERFMLSPEGFGIVRAKTGTLSDVSGLTGTLRDVDGRLLVFAVVSNDVVDIFAARPTLDAFAAALVGCGCR